MKHLIAFVLIFILFSFYKIISQFGFDALILTIAFIPIVVGGLIAWYCWCHFKYETRNCGPSCTKCCASCPCREGIKEDLNLGSSKCHDCYKKNTCPWIKKGRS